MSFLTELQGKGVTSEMLDGLVHDAASRIASRTNNEGMQAQLALIEEAGIPEFEIKDWLEDEGHLAAS
jgi:hypothetical protein